MEPLIVDPAEAGTKLLRFLEKHLAGSDVSPAVLHRWVRTGQVRRNGGRAQPFARLEAGDRFRKRRALLAQKTLPQQLRAGESAYRPSCGCMQ